MVRLVRLWMAADFWASRDHRPTAKSQRYIFYRCPLLKRHTPDMQRDRGGVPGGHDRRTEQSTLHSHVECDDYASRPRKRLCVGVAVDAATGVATTWADLPDEMIYAIARQCSVGTLARLGLVERRAHAISTCQRLWKRLYRVADGVHRVCPAGFACAHARRHRTAIGGVISRHRPTLESVSQHVRQWLDNHALTWLVDRAQGRPTGASNPWQWSLFWCDPLRQCVCHAPCTGDSARRANRDGDEDEDDDQGDDDYADDDDDDDDDGAGFTDYRWLYATSLPWPVVYNRMTHVGIKTKRIGRMCLSADKWQGLRALDWPTSASFWSRDGGDIVTHYSGETDDQGRPDGRGTLTVVSLERTLLRISGTWRRGQPHGAVRAYNYVRKGDDMAYFEGQCRRGEPHGRGLAVYGRRSVFDGMWDDGCPMGAGLSCSADRLERYGAHRGSLHTIMWQTVLRADGTVACETEFIDPYDEHMQNPVHEFASDTDDSDNDRDTDQDTDETDIDKDDEDDEDDHRGDEVGENGDDAPTKDTDAAEIQILLDRLTRETGSLRHRLRAHPMARMDHAGIRDRSGRVIYSGCVTDAYVPKPNRGTLHLRDGTAITHAGRTTKSGSRRLVAVTYSQGDRVACLFGTKGAGASLPRVIGFTYSRDAPKGLAGRTLKGSWRVSAMPYPRTASDSDHEDPVNRASLAGDNVDDDEEEQDGRNLVSIRDCPKDLVITHLARDPPYDHVLDNMATLADFVFWPAERGREREAFFDHMIERYGQRWALCRSMADVAP